MLEEGVGPVRSLSLLLLNERCVHVLIRQPLVLGPWHRQRDCVSVGRCRVATSVTTNQIADEVAA